MFADQITGQKIKTEFTKLQKKHVDDIILFLEDCLTLFPAEYKNHFQTIAWRDEREVTPLFSNYLSQKSRSDNKPYNFTHQYPQSSQSGKSGKSREVDIGVTFYVKGYFYSKPIFVIECKWLKLPPSTSKHYVCGNTGGIERFKRELHGKELDHCAIIAFIEGKCFNYWLDIINTWIKDLFDIGDNSLNWQEADFLEIVKKTETIAKYVSENKRKTDYIKIHHLWIKMFPEQ
jgi:hypothetical protein